MYIFKDAPSYVATKCFHWFVSKLLNVPIDGNEEIEFAIKNNGLALKYVQERLI